MVLGNLSSKNLNYTILILKNPNNLNMANYKIHRNKLTSLLIITERIFHEEQLEINVNDSTKCWKIIKEVKIC